jgi:hypothetical protein
MKCSQYDYLNVLHLLLLFAISIFMQCKGLLSYLGGQDAGDMNDF